MQPADPEMVRAALRSARQAGPYFAVSLGGTEPGWRPAAEVYRQGMRELIDRAGAQLGSTEPRVAAATVHLGYAARLWSPVLSGILTHGVVPDLAGLRLMTSPALRLDLPEPRGWQSAEPHEQATLAARTVLDGHLEPLRATLPVKVAAGLLHGNAAASMTAALRVLASIRPQLQPHARELAAALLEVSPLRGTGELSGLEFRRRSCCLFYRVPGGGLCGDCSLSRPR